MRLRRRRKKRRKLNVQVRNSRILIKSPSQGRMKILRTKNDGMIRLDDSCQPTRLLPDDNYVCVNVRFVFATRFPGGYVYRVRSSSCRRVADVSSSCRVVVIENSRTFNRFFANNFVKEYFEYFYFLFHFNVDICI